MDRESSSGSENVIGCPECRQNTIILESSCLILLPHRLLSSGEDERNLTPDLRSHGWIEANGMCRVACRSLKCKRSPMLEKQEKCFNELWENGTNYTLPY